MEIFSVKNGSIISAHNKVNDSFDTLRVMAPWTMHYQLDLAHGFVPLGSTVC